MRHWGIESYLRVIIYLRVGSFSSHFRGTCRYLSPIYMQVSYGSVVYVQLQLALKFVHILIPYSWSFRGKRFSSKYMLYFNHTSRAVGCGLAVGQAMKNILQKCTSKMYLKLDSSILNESMKKRDSFFIRLYLKKRCQRLDLNCGFLEPKASH